MKDERRAGRAPPALAAGFGADLGPASAKVVPGSLGAVGYDDEGVKTKRWDIIKDGILAVMLLVQIITGVVLVMHYTPHVDMAFNSVEHIMRDVNSGWMLRYMHANGASMFFIAVCTARRLSCTRCCDSGGSDASFSGSARSSSWRWSW